MNVEIQKANDLVEVLRDAARDNLDGQTLDDAAMMIERLAAALNWALVTLECKGDTCSLTNINALLDGTVPTDRAY